MRSPMRHCGHRRCFPSADHHSFEPARGSDRRRTYPSFILTRRGIMKISMISTALFAAAACVSITIASCDSSSGPAAPGSQGVYNGGKGSHVLADGNFTAIQIDRAGSGEAAIASNDVGALT